MSATIHISQMNKQKKHCFEDKLSNETIGPEKNIKLKIEKKCE